MSIALLVCHEGSGIAVLVPMLSIYELTPKGKKTRSQLIATLNQQDGLTRHEIVEQSGLSYEQVRRQTQNLVSEGKIKSCIVNGQRRYYVQIVALLFVSLIPIYEPIPENDAISNFGYELTSS